MLPEPALLSAEEFRGALVRLIETDTPEFMANGLGSPVQAVAAYYRNTEYAPAWTTLADSLGHVDALLGALRGARSHGLDPNAYHIHELDRALAEAYSDRPPKAVKVAELDLRLSVTFMRLAADLNGGQIDPRTINGGMHAERPGIDLAGVLESALAENRIAELLEEMAPRHEAYQRLRRAIPLYERIVADGGWVAVESGTTLHPGDSDPRIVAVRMRLIVTGELSDTDISSARYDPALAAAVKLFQKRHGLEPDGVIGAQSLAALNVSALNRLAQIRINLERWRWLPEEFGSRHVIVNVPEFTLRGYRDDKKEIEMAVVVGTVYDERATPIFMEKMTHLIFSPYWNAPPTIAKEELVPPALRDTGYLTRHHYEIVNRFGPSARIIPPDFTALKSVAAGRLRIRQTPGPWNALGHVKFLFPNQFSVYLHDTPEDHLFKQARRAFSHGCIRVEHPGELADWVLSEQGRWTKQKIRQAMYAGAEKQVNLKDPISVYILYWTAFPDEDGGVQFREDIYGHDTPLVEFFRFS